MGGILLPVATSAKSIRPDSNSSRLILILLPLVIIDDFDVPCFTLAPSKTYPPLIVDADAVLSDAFAFQRLQAIRRWDTQIVEALCGTEHPQLPPGHSLYLDRQPT